MAWRTFELFLRRVEVDTNSDKQRQFLVAVVVVVVVCLFLFVFFSISKTCVAAPELALHSSKSLEDRRLDY